MDRGVRISIAATIMLAGATLAVLSRRNAVDAARPVLAPGEQLILRDQTLPRELGVPQVEQASAVPPARPSATVSPPVDKPRPATDASLARGTWSPQRTTARPLRHRIVDGDTLPQLAQRYLGSAERQGEIFEANRNVLPSPDLLPIGAMLAIPARDLAAP